MKKSVLLFFRSRLLRWILFLVITLFISSGILFLQVDPELSRVLPTHSSILNQKNEAANSFSKTEDIVLFIESPQGVFTPETLSALQELYKNIENEFQLSHNYILGIFTSFTRFKHLVFDQAEAQRFQEIAESLPALSETFLDSTRTNSIIALTLPADAFSTEEKIIAAIHQLENITQDIEKRFPAVKISVTGRPTIRQSIMSYMRTDLMILFPATIIATFFLLRLLIGSFWGALIPIIVSLIALLWTFGLKGWIGSPLTIVESPIPIFLISIGCADGVHIMSDLFMELRHQKTFRKALNHTMRLLRYPIILTSLTTSIGFLSLTSSSGESFRNLGLFMAFGVIVAMFVSLWVVPLLLSYIQLKPLPDGNWSYRFADMISKFFKKILYILLRHPRLYFALFSGLFGLSILSFFYVRVDFDEISYLHRSTSVRQLAERLQSDFGGIASLDLILTSSQPNFFRKLSSLQFIDQIEEKLLEKHQTISFSTSINSFIKGLNYRLRGEKVSEFRLPPIPIAAEKIIELVERNPELQNIASNYTNEDWTSTRLSLRIKTLSTYSIKEIVNDIEKTLQEIFQQEISLDTAITELNNSDIQRIELAGDYYRTFISETLVQEQIKTLGLTILAIGLVTMYIFHSFLGSLFIVFSVIWAIFFNFTIMWLFNISLNPGTITIASIGMGVGVDYTIHFFNAFRHAYSQLKDYRKAIFQALEFTVDGIIVNALAVSLGFTLLFFSAYEIVQIMVVIIALTMTTTAFSALTILPMSIYIFKPSVSSKQGILDKFLETKKDPEKKSVQKE